MLAFPAGLALFAALAQHQPKTEPTPVRCLQVIDAHAGTLHDIDVASDGPRFAVGADNGHVLVYTLADGSLVKDLALGGSAVMDVEFDARGEQLLAVQLGSAQVWNARSLEPVRTVSGQKLGMLRGVFAPDGRSIATGSCGNGAKPDEPTEACVWELESGKRCAEIEGLAYRVRVSFRPDGSALLATSESSPIGFVQDIAGKRSVVSLKGHTGGIAWSAWSPDGRTVLTAGTDLTCRLWNAETGKELRALHGHEGYLLLCAFSPDGKEALTTSWVDRTTRVWNVKTGKQRLLLSGHEDRPTAVRVSPDGRALASFDFAGHGLLFRLDSGQLVGTLSGHTQCVSAIDFTPDSTRIVSASLDGTIRVWANPLTP